MTPAVPIETSTSTTRSSPASSRTARMPCFRLRLLKSPKRASSCACRPKACTTMIAWRTSERSAAIRPSRWRWSRTASRSWCEKRKAVSVISGSTARLAAVSCQSMTNITPSMPKTTSTSLRMMSTLSTSISRSMFVSPVARSTRSPARWELWTERESRWRWAK